MNTRQLKFIEHTMLILKQMIDLAAANGSASQTLGRKRVGKHVVRITLVAERERGFSTPIGSHASSLTTPPANIKTEHHSRSRTSRWQKNVF